MKALAHGSAGFHEKLPEWNSPTALPATIALRRQLRCYVKPQFLSLRLQPLSIWKSAWLLGRFFRSPISTSAWRNPVRRSILRSVVILTQRKFRRHKNAFSVGHRVKRSGACPSNYLFPSRRNNSALISLADYDSACRKALPSAGKLPIVSNQVDFHRKCSSCGLPNIALSPVFQP